MRIQQGLPGDKRSKLRSPGSKVQVFYTHMKQWECETVSNYGHKNSRGTNGIWNNSNRRTIGAAVLMDKRQVTM